ncbi:MAG: hypothetical protein ACE5F1_04495 [Planctomycetota bacterium]
MMKSSAVLGTAVGCGLLVFGGQGRLPGASPPQVQIHVGNPGGAPIFTASSPDSESDGSSLMLPESTNLNRILGKAAGFFAREKWEEGARVLQDLLEGKSLVVGPDNLDDPRRSVYSADGRLYMPFSQYCQKLLCSLPAEGLESYRLLMDPLARDEFDSCTARLDAEGLGRLVDLYFATSFGAKIVSLLADIHTIRGNLPGAVHLRGRLLREAPDLSEEEVRRLWLRQLHAFAVMGEEDRYHDAYRALIDLDPRAAYRVNGSLIPVDELLATPAFRLRSGRKWGSRSSEGGGAAEEGADTGLTGVGLLPLWKMKFADPDPYGLKPKGNRNRNVFVMGRGASYFVSAKSFRPGTTAAVFRVSEGRRVVAVKDHDQIVVRELLSGKALSRESSVGGSQVRRYGNNVLNVRSPSTDIGLQRLHRYRGKLYGTIGNRAQPSQRSGAFPFRNSLISVDIESGEAVRFPPQKSSERLFFQTPPVGYRDWLYAPVRKGRSFCIARLRVDTGRVESVVTVHSGGSIFTRVPCVPPVAVGHQLLYLTNAGVVASFSLPDLELLWLRRYEKKTPHQAPERTWTRATRSWGIQQRSLKHWKPTLPLVFRGRVVLAPSDSNALLCLDLHSGEMLWTLPRKESSRRRSVDFNEVVGLHEHNLYIAGNLLQCIDVISGKRIWEVPLDEGRIVQSLGSSPKGRGCVVAGNLYLPYLEGVARFRCSDGGLDGLMKFPLFHESERRLKGPVNIQIHGSIMLAMSEYQITAFTIPEDIIAHAKPGMDRVRRMVAACRVSMAWEELAAWLGLAASGEREKSLGDSEREEAVDLFVRLTGELASEKKEAEGPEQALALIDRSQEVLGKLDPAVEEPRLVLFRIEALQGAGQEARIRALRERLVDMKLGGRR